MNIVWIEIITKGIGDRIGGREGEIDYEYYDREGLSDDELKYVIEDDMMGRGFYFPNGSGRYMTQEWNFIDCPSIDYINSEIGFHKKNIVRSREVVDMLEGMI
jgi:hypothetical protein